MTSEASNSRMEVLQRFRCDVLLWFVCGLVMQSWFWHGFSNDFDMGQNCEQNLKTYQNHINIASKSYQNPKTLEKSTKSLSLLLFCFLFSNQPTWTFKKQYQNRIKTVSNHIKSYPIPYLPDPNHNQNHIKPYRNHNLTFKAYRTHILESYHNHIKSIDNHWTKSWN